MRINLDEFQKILKVFLDSDCTNITLRELGINELTESNEETFIFHMLLLVENGLLSNSNLETGTPACVGLIPTRHGYDWVKVPIRLTQDGHDFANALNQKPILERLKKEFTDAPFDMVKDVSKSLLTKLIKNRLDIE